MVSDKMNPKVPISATEIANLLAKQGALQEALKKQGTLQEAIKQLGKTDLSEHVPFSMRIGELLSQGKIPISLQQTLKQGNSSSNALAEALQKTSLTDRLRAMGMGQPDTLRQFESTHSPSQSASASTNIQSAADIGFAVRAARKAKGLTQQQFADLAGVGRRFLSELETGKPTLEIGKVLKVTAAAGFQIKLRPAGQTDE